MAGTHRQSPEESEGLRRLWRRHSLRAALPYVGIGVLLVLAIVALGREITHHIDAIEAWIASLGPWGVLAFIALFVVATSLLIPDTLLCVIAGVLFGIPWGVAAVVAGSLLGASLQYVLSRRLLRARIERMLAARPSLSAIQRAVRHDEFRLQVLLRLTPLNPATISYLLGTAGVRFSGFLVACLALVPALFIEVYFGHAGKHMATAAGDGARTSTVHDIAVIVGVGIGILVLVVVSRMARTAIHQAVAESSGTDA